MEKIIVPSLRRKYNHVKVIKYAAMKKVYVDNYFRSIKGMGADYIYFADINNSPCIAKKKEEIRKRHKYLIGTRIVIVVKEIESWYLAGLSERSSKDLGLQNLNSTDHLTKEQFNSLIPKKFDSRIDFMLEVLKRFSVSDARRKNGSFKYFWDKYILS